MRRNDVYNDLKSIFDLRRQTDSNKRRDIFYVDLPKKINNTFYSGCFRNPSIGTDTYNLCPNALCRVLQRDLLNRKCNVSIRIYS